MNNEHRRLVCILLLLFSIGWSPHLEGQSNWIPKVVVIPKYPSLAHLGRIEGEVTIHCQLDANGKVKDIDVKSGDRLLRQAASDASKKWIFVQSSDGHLEVDGRFEIVFHFEISGRCPGVDLGSCAYEGRFEVPNKVNIVVEGPRIMPD
jgi:TonB family protein